MATPTAPANAEAVAEATDMALAAAAAEAFTVDKAAAAQQDSHQGSTGAWVGGHPTIGYGIEVGLAGRVVEMHVVVIEEGVEVTVVGQTWGRLHSIAHTFLRFHDVDSREEIGKDAKDCNIR